MLKGIYKDILFTAGLIALAFGLYLRSIGFELTFLDDNVWLKDYIWYLKDHKNLFKVFAKPDILFGGLFYRPMIYFTFILDSQITLDGYAMYHITNILLHGLCGGCVYALLRCLDYDRTISMFFATVFIVHPVLTQAVVWIPGRTDSLLGLFVFLSLIGFVCALRYRNGVLFILHLLAWILALLTKETAVAVPLVCAAYVFLYDRRKLGWKTITFGAGIWILIGAGYALLRRAILLEKSNLADDVVVSSLWNNLPAVVGYVGKIFWPVNLSVLPVLEDINLNYGWVCLMVLIGITFWPGRKDYGRIAFGLIWFLLFLLPSFVGSFLKHEYRLYIPIVGIMILLIELKILQRLEKKFPSLALIGAVLLVGVFAATSWRYSMNYRGHYAFWTNAVQTSPHSPLARRNLGAMYFLDHKFEEAEQEFLAALRLNPRESMVYNNLGLIYERRGELEKAERAYLNEVINNPGYDTVYYNLGLFYGKQHKYDKAVQMWTTTTELNPRHLMAHKYLAVYFAKTRQEDKSNHHLRELLKRGVTIPDDVEDLIR